MMNDLSRRDFMGTAAVSAAAGLMGCEKTEKPGQTPHTKFAVNLEIWWTELPILERMKKTAELGFQGVEFWPYDNKDLDAMRKASEALGLTICQFTAWGFEPGMNDPANHDLVESQIREACEAARKLNCKMATVVGGNDQPDMTQEEMHGHIITALKRVAPIAEDYDVTLILEPMNIRVDHKGHCLYGTEAAVKICREVDSSHVKINWDLYHAHISEGDLCGHLRDGFDQLGYVQVADHPGRKEPGTGEIYYPRVLKELWDLGYRGFVGLECWPVKDEITAARRVFEADWR